MAVILVPTSGEDMMIATKNGTRLREDASHYAWTVDMIGTGVRKNKSKTLT